MIDLIKKYADALFYLAQVIALIGAFLLGLKLGAAVGQSKADKAQLDRAVAAERSATQARQQLEHEIKRGDELQARLITSENTRITLAQEKDNALRRLTAGRPCLSQSVVRVLNLPASADANAVVDAARESVSADAPAATDTDVALWARSCRDQYDTCRGRLDAIAEFYQERP